MDYSQPIEHFIDQLRMKLRNVEFETEKIFRLNSVFTEMSARGIDINDLVAAGQVFLREKELLIAAPNIPAGVFGSKPGFINGRAFHAFVLNPIFFDNNKLVLSVPSSQKGLEKFVSEFEHRGVYPMLDFPSLKTDPWFYRTYEGFLNIMVGVGKVEKVEGVEKK